MKGDEDPKLPYIVGLALLQTKSDVYVLNKYIHTYDEKNNMLNLQKLKKIF